MTSTDCLIPLPATLERELNILGVRRAPFFVVKAAAVDRTYRKTVLDENGNPEF